MDCEPGVAKALDDALAKAVIDKELGALLSGGSSLRTI